jgi:ATP-dependent Clp protease ATP-binding subunit ClpC
MFERFTDRARRVVVLAQEEARMLNHDYIGTEHLLLGLIREGEGVAPKALESLGISLEDTRQQVEQIIGQGTSVPSGHIPFTPRAKKVMELSLREAIQLGHNYIGTEHILLGLVREGEGVAAQVLEKLGADLNRVRQEVIKLLSGYVARSESESGTGLTTEETEVMTRVAEGYSTAEIARELSLSKEAVKGHMGRILQRLGAKDRSEAVVAWLRLRVSQARDIPLCPGCQADLSQVAVVHSLDLQVVGSDETRAVSFAFCRRCGTWLGTV